ncbi:MAG: hypothetical protein AAFO95_05545 [Cyanobacteria bacterium J06600_6]
MNTSPKNNKNRLPEWQSARMRSLIEERWSEIWDIVVARESNNQNSGQYSERSPHS